MKQMILDIGLLDMLAAQIGCEYLSDLRRPNTGQRIRLASVIERLPPDAASLAEWNDALDYLAAAPPASAPEEARRRLIEKLLEKRACNENGFQNIF